MLENPGQAFVLLLLPVFLSPAHWPFQLDVKPNIKNIFPEKGTVVPFG